MTIAIIIMSSIAACIGAALWLARRGVTQSPDSPVEKIDALLPQTQCGQCGYAGCRPYAEAIANGTADIDQCAPGGDSTATALANLLGRPVTSINPAFGNYEPASVAVIDEDACIGCALCIAACPVDAIVGAHRYTHTVIRSECTGCKLCLPPCPVDCIRIEPLRMPRKAA
ncbi:MAG: electron transport complex subunit RsxB [Gammaproteobacteria bacterium]|nr:electron transport complex subunit RsxB [Gammaproteobacteria bacterium]NND53683.1 electron transport complex subunit RsxB [Gammaproteobacteria bacterium]